MANADLVADLVIVEADYYDDITGPMTARAGEIFNAAGLSFDRVSAPGAFEIPSIVKTLFDQRAYSAFLTVGCVIRGETDHYDHICRETSRALMDLSLLDGLALSFGVLTVENKAQALARVDPNGKDKGRECADALIHMMRVKGLLGSK